MSGIDAGFYEQGELWDEHDEDPAALRQRFEATASLVPPGIRSVLEVGAGDGRLLDGVHALRPWTGDVVAVERSLAALGRNPWPGVAASIDRVGIRAGAAELVLCCEVLEHLPTPVFDLARSELARLSRRWVIVTVPNRENRRRATVRCSDCGCTYNPMRHLRSFAPDDLASLLPGYRLTRLEEAGPRSVVYPRLMRVLLERVGVLRRSGAPTCPQCGAPYSRTATSPSQRDGDGDGALRTTDPVIRRFVPRRRHRYWLCALYERTGN